MALGRSPEEKIKGHSGAINRGPLMLYTNIKALADFYKTIFKMSQYNINISLLIFFKCSFQPRLG